MSLEEVDCSLLDLPAGQTEDNATPALRRTVWVPQREPMSRPNKDKTTRQSSLTGRLNNQFLFQQKDAKMESSQESNLVSLVKIVLEPGLDSCREDSSQVFSPSYTFSSLHSLSLFLLTSREDKSHAGNKDDASN